ncbi:MAG: lysylphosphatidylglycerol synthase domain-containing protein [Pseudomonadota bacterium]
MRDIWNPGSFHLSASAVVLVIAVAWMVTLLHFVMEPWRWRFAYLPASENRDDWRKVRDSLYCTAFATYLLPFKLGLPLRVALLRGSARLDLRYIGAVLALDGLISLVVWSMLAAVCVWVAALRWQPPTYVWIAGALGTAGLGALLLFRRNLRGRLAAHWREAMAAFARPWLRIAKASTIVGLDVLSYGVRHALLVFLVTGNPADMLPGAAIGIVATFAGIVSGLPMGLLGYDATLVALLGIAGVPGEHALFVALINRGLNIGSAVLLGVPASARLGMGSRIPSILARLRELAHGKH